MVLGQGATPDDETRQFRAESYERTMADTIQPETDKSYQLWHDNTETDTNGAGRDPRRRDAQREHLRVSVERQPRGARGS